MNLSEPQLISPLLDGFVMGDPISGHDGVRACPAMLLETDQKYIVKIISLPASQSKLDALLLAGAFSDRESALNYFKELADGVLNEAELLQKLSKHEGFVAFDNWQMVPMEEDETGFDIYLLSQYRPTLEGVLKANEMTHLQAVNLGLDLCAALSVSRRFGYLFANLKPGNIYICNDREFRIGDLGFLSLDSLQYASLPDKYHSDYTPPEISDAYSALNSTMDTYAVGLILYQAYNDGRLPVVGMMPDAPKYADPALAEIILKACSADPAERWQDPAQMGQALASYMQSNSVNDTPIVPPVAEEEAEKPAEIFPNEDTEPSTDDILAEVDEAIENAPPIVSAPASEEAVEDSVEEIIEVTEEPEVTEESVDFEIEASEDEPAEEEIAEELAEEATEAAPVEEEPLDETAQMLAQADDLIAHQLPEPPVAPEPIEVTLPDPEQIILEIPEEIQPSEEIPVVLPSDEAEESAEPEKENEALFEENEEYTEEPKKKRKGLVVTAIILACALVIATAVLFYQFFYLQTIDKIALHGREDRLSVMLTTHISDEKLTVKCVDPHGNALTANVENGVANFFGLKPSTKYTLEVRISGFHKLLGEITTSYTTATQTIINGFFAATGPEDGSVILSFTHQGPDSSQWTVTYSADGEAEKTATFTGHIVTLNGLTVNKQYTFKLTPVTDLYISGNDTVTYTASKLVYAEDLQIIGFTENGLGITWKTPEGVTVPKWYIRCYNDAGYDKTLTTSENVIYFAELDPAAGYNIEVTAEGMSLGARANIAANSVFVKNVQVDAPDRNQLKVTWEFDGQKAASDWMVTYIIDNGAKQQTVYSTEASIVIAPLIPGAHYTICIGGADGESIFAPSVEYDAPAAVAFNGYLVTADNMEFYMCQTPSKASWNRHDVAQNSYTTTFTVGTSASFVSHLDTKTSKVDDMITILYVIRDAEGILVRASTEARSWDDMWDNRYGTLTIPVMPEAPGSYTVQIYFNGTSAATQSFTIVAG